MPAFPTQTTISNAPAGTNYGSPAALLALLQSLIYIHPTGQPLTGFAKQPNAPNDTTKVWFKLDLLGGPLGIYFYYSGAWRPFHMKNGGDFKWSNVAWPLDAAIFDANGLGRKGLPQDSFQFCNGLNGSPDTRDKMIICANDGRYFTNGEWTQLTLNRDGTEIITAGQPGGVKTANLQVPNLPPMRFTYERAHLAPDNRWQGGTNPFGPPVPPYQDATSVTVGGLLLPVTGVAATDLLTSPGHGFLAGNSVVFSTTAGAGEIVQGRIYYVSSAGLTVDDFKIGNAIGGPILDFTTDMTGGYVSKDGTIDIMPPYYALAQFMFIGYQP